MRYRKDFGSLTVIALLLGASMSLRAQVTGAPTVNFDLREINASADGFTVTWQIDGLTARGDAA